MIRPKLKKQYLDHEEYSDFRSISNLKFTSKMIEKAISYQLTNYLRDNDLEEGFNLALFAESQTETVSQRSKPLANLSIPPKKVQPQSTCEEKCTHRGTHQF